MTCVPLEGLCLGSKRHDPTSSLSQGGKLWAKDISLLPVDGIQDHLQMTAPPLTFIFNITMNTVGFESSMFIFIVFKMGGLYMSCRLTSYSLVQAIPRLTLQVARSTGVYHHTQYRVCFISSLVCFLFHFLGKLKFQHALCIFLLSV